MIKILAIKKTNSFIVMLSIGLPFILAIFLLGRQVEFAKRNFLSLYQNLTDYRKAVWNVKDINLDGLKKQIETMYQRFPSADKLPLVMKEISASAKEYNIQLSSITPAEKSEVAEDEKEYLSMFSRIRLDMRVSGAYEDLSAFMTGLSHLSNGVIKTNSFHFEKSSTGSDMNLNLESFFYVKKKDFNLLGDVSFDSALVSNSKSASRFQSYRRNPFSEEIVQDETSIHLEGIIFDPTQPIALINGEAFKAGDTVGNARILRIEPDHVVLERENEQFEARLNV